MPSSTAGNVRPLKPRRAATRLGPKEAHELAQRARERGYAPGAARALLMHLLKVCDPRQDFARPIPHHTQATSRGEVLGMTYELGVSVDTIGRASRVLEQHGLIRVDRGVGRTWTRYQLDPVRIIELLGELPGSPWVTKAFLAGHLPGSPQEIWAVETPQDAESESADCGVRVRKMPAPYAHAREEDPSKTFSPTPDPARPAVGGWGDPPASGQGPLSSESTRCEHGRTVAQGGCRRCGTTQRDRATAEDQAARLAERDRRLAQQAQTSVVATSAAPPAEFLAARAQLRAPTEGEPAMQATDDLDTPLPTDWPKPAEPAPAPRPWWASLDATHTRYTVPCPHGIEHRVGVVKGPDGHLFFRPHKRSTYGGSYPCGASLRPLCKVDPIQGRPEVACSHGKGEQP